MTPDLPPYTLRGFDISRNGNRLAFDAVYENRYWFYCVTLGADGSISPPRLVCATDEETWACHLSHDGGLLPLSHPPGTFRGRSGPFHTGTAATFFGPDGTVWAQWSDATQPPRLLSLAADDPPKPVLPVDECPSGHPWRPVSFPSSDGVSVQAWLGLPSGADISDGPFPTFLHVHGGPSGAVSNAFDASSQAWLDHGFAYLTVNYRGSTGFGRAFQEKINGDVGHWELEDMLAARRWLIEQGIANPHQVLLEGGSYGGFLTVWALSQRPELWAGGVAPVAIVVWTMNYEDSSAAMRGWARMIFGGSAQEKSELYRQRSPLTHAAAIQAPLLIVQGRHDSRATPRQMEVFTRRMEELNKEFALIWLDSGHGTGSTAIAERIQETHLKFPYRALGLA